MPDRLRTMRHAVGWSYDLLTDDERRLFRRLSVFAGGCTIEMAESL
jgi:predicted ATPase